MLLVFLFCLLQFLQRYLSAKEKLNEEFGINTFTLFPTKKYNLNERQMVTSNTKTVLFMTASLVFVLWSFLASFMLPKQHRYIGVSLVAVTFSVGALYVISRIKESLFILASDFKNCNNKFY